MRFCSIASGSSGNCIYVGTQETHLLIDAGISGRRIEKGLNELDLTGKDVDGILITHEHSDHIGGLGVISRKYQIPIYTTGGTADAISRSKGLGQLPQGQIPFGSQSPQVFTDNFSKIHRKAPFWWLCFLC